MTSNENRYDLEHGFTMPGWYDLDERVLGDLVNAAHANCRGDMGSSAEVHVALHVVAERQVVDFPPATRALERVMEAGATRHDAIHHIAFVNAALIDETLAAGKDAHTEEELEERLNASTETMHQMFGEPLDQADWDGFSPEWLDVDETKELEFDAEMDPRALHWAMRLAAAFELQADACHGWALVYVRTCLSQGDDFRELKRSECAELFKEALFYTDADPSHATEIISELQAFFGFCQDHFGMEHGAACAQLMATPEAHKQVLDILEDKPGAEELRKLSELLTPDADGNLSPEAIAMIERAENPSDAPKPFVRTKARVGRNEPCPCGSGKKYKKCCA